LVQKGGCEIHAHDAYLAKAATFYGPRHDAVIRVYDAAGNVIETHRHAGDFKEP
jgi:hypothetical protein